MQSIIQKAMKQLNLIILEYDSSPPLTITLSATASFYILKTLSQILDSKVWELKYHILGWVERPVTAQKFSLF